MDTSREIKKCPSCLQDCWRDEMTRSGYCVPCGRLKGRKSATKARRTDPEGYNAYHREYRIRRAKAGDPLHDYVSDELAPGYKPRV